MRRSITNPPPVRPLVSLALAAALAMPAALALPGCGAQPGTTVMSYGKGDTPPPLANAEESAVYALYPNTGANPIFRKRLEKGDEFGFAKRSDGTVVGVIDGEEIPLESTVSTGYYWKKQE